MNPAREEDALTLSGPPRNVSARIRIDASERVVRVAVKLVDGPSVLRAYVRPYGGGDGELRLKLPPATAPGTYRGEAVIGDRKRVLVANVTAEPSVLVAPAQTTVQAASGGRVEFSIHLTNAGNVAFEVPKESPLELDDDVDQGLAFGRALRAELGEGEHRVDRLFDELVESHGGQGRVTVIEGAGPLEPGQSRGLRCGLDVPERARPGRTYTGGWEPAWAGHLLVLEVVNGSGDEPRLRAGRKP
jgi:hypothetical protein